MNQFFAHTISAWTLPGGISCDDDDDQARLERFLTKFPRIEKAIVKNIAKQAPSQAAHANAPPSVPTPETNPSSDAAFRPLAISPIAAAPLPKRPMRLAEARVKYIEHYKNTLETQNVRTTDDKGRILDMFVDHLRLKHPELGPDPWVHTIDAAHLSGFLAEQSQRPGKRVDNDGNAMRAAPKTLLKKLGDITHFFRYLKTILKATQEDLTVDSAEAAEAWRNRAKVEDVHYEPFTNDHIRRIFEPASYLAKSRDPDYFWGPLLGLHFGVRLGDFVTAKLKDIGHIQEIDTWYIDIPYEVAKNSNSVRRLPITEPLIRLGFLRYVEHLRRLGAEHLFPHRDWTTPTAMRDPSKQQSRRFGEYLEAIGIQSSRLVFHSFRHTVVSVMQDAGVPLSHAMQIAGHEAQDHALKTGRITEQQARSVHQSVYTHADLERMGTDFPILKLKEALESSVKPPIDYACLATAAEIVLEHTKKIGSKFRTGWPPQRQGYTDELTARLDAVKETSAHPVDLQGRPVPKAVRPVTTENMEQTAGSLGAGPDSAGLRRRDASAVL